MDSFVYHSPADLLALGQQVRDKAIELQLNDSDDYGDAQVRANDLTAPLPGYNGPTYPDLGATGDDVVEFLRAENAGLPAYYTAFGVPDPTLMQPTVDGLQQLVATLRPDLTVTGSTAGDLAAPQYGRSLLTTHVNDVVNAVNTRLSAWDGVAAEAFKIYLSRLPIAAEYQRSVAISLAVTMTIQMEIRKRMLTDIWEIGTKTIKTMEAATAWCPGGARSVSVALTVAGAVTAVVIAPEVVAAEGLQLAGTVLSSKPSASVSDDIGGHTVYQVLQSMYRVIGRLHALIADQRSQVAHALQVVRTDLQDEWGNALLPPPNRLADMQTAGINVIAGQHLFYDR